MNAQVWIRDELRGCPLPGLLAEVGLDMTVDCRR